MVVFLEVIAGADEGLKFKAEDGLQIGRARGQIILSDPKVSSLHAEVKLDSRGQLILNDLNSSNGLIINGRKVKKVALLPGVVFEIGRTQVKVLQLEDSEAEVIGSVVTWRHQISEELLALPLTDVTVNTSIEALSQAVVLSFTQGIQLNTEITIGYVPRIAGKSGLDIELLEDGAPDEAFKITSGPGQAYIETLAPMQILLNDKTFSKEPLNDGDKISFGNTVIRVQYLG